MRAKNRRRRLWERQGGKCHICGQPIDIEASVQEAHGPSIDHLVPRSRGGRGVQANTALAHKFCNNFRGSQSLNEEIAAAARVRLLAPASPEPASPDPASDFACATQPSIRDGRIPERSAA